MRYPGTPARPSRPVHLGRALVALVALLGLATVATGCSEGGAEGPTEVHPEVETPYDEAVRLSLEAVPDSDLVRVALDHTDGRQPVWRAKVANPDGTAHVVALKATTGDLVRKSVPGAVPPVSEGTLTRLEEAQLVPEEAARQVTKPDFGKVTLIEIGAHEGRPVWFVEVTSVEEDQVRRSAVDAVTGEVLGGSPVPADPGHHREH